MAKPIVTSHSNAPGTVYARFIAEREAHLSPRTIKFYREKLAPFIVWCETQHIGDLRIVRRADVAMFLSAIRKGRRTDSRTGLRPLSNDGLKLHHQVLSTLFNYVGDTCDVGRNWTNPVKGIKTKHSDAQTMEYSEAEIARMRQIVLSRKNSSQRLRDTAILTVLLNSGMRASDLLGMKIRDLQDDGKIKVTGKGSKDRVVAVGQTGVDAIRTYLSGRAAPSDYVWLTVEGTRLSYSGFKTMLNRIESADSIFTDGVYPHRFRHTAITRLLRARVPLRSVQRYAGHSNPQTTLRYAHALDADSPTLALAKAVPPNGIRGNYS